MMWFFRVARPSQCLAIASRNPYDDVKIAKKAWILPWRTCKVFDIAPLTYNFDVKALSSDKIPFTLQTVFTIGPCIDDQRCLVRYARLALTYVKPSDHAKSIAQSIVRDMSRSLTILITMEEIFSGIEFLNHELFEEVQVELNKLGLIIYCASVKPLINLEDFHYLNIMKQKTEDVELYQPMTQAEVVLLTEDSELYELKKAVEVVVTLAMSLMEFRDTLVKNNELLGTHGREDENFIVSCNDSLLGLQALLTWMLDFLPVCDLHCRMLISGVIDAIMRVHDQKYIQYIAYRTLRDVNL